MNEGVLGIYWLVRDPEDPLTARLEPDRSMQAVSQGELYNLSIRPYMTAESLTVLGSTGAPNSMTDYSFRFKHPFDLPADFDPPSTAQKRLDLFIFDVQLVVAATGSDLFFNGTLKTNTVATGAVNGFRQLGPLVDLSRLGVNDGTNVFPYRLIHRIDGGNPAGNYGTDGWIGDEWFGATGYDVIPQGATADSSIRLSNYLANPIPIVVVAKYMDPRAGSDGPEKRFNRLPNADPANLRYFLPEAAGDIQSILATVEGTLKDSNSEETATINLHVLDWDNAATVTSSFPNHADLNAISEASKPTQVEASFPLLRANGVFTSSGIGPGTGTIKEYVDITIPVINIDQSFTAPPDGALVNGLVRIRDSQDFTAPEPFLLDENLVPQSAPPGYEPSTRYQLVKVPVVTGKSIPDITAVDPLIGVSAKTATFTATNIGGDPLTWTWGFGGGAIPNTSTAASPTVQFAAPGNYTCLVRAGNESGEDTFFFNLVVEEGSPLITDVEITGQYALQPATFSAINEGEPATSWEWDFGGGATPDTSTAESPNVRLYRPGTYTGSVTAYNEGGQHTYEFEFTPEVYVIDLRLQVIKSGTTWPKVLYGMDEWSLSELQDWVQARFNSPFYNAGVQIDIDNIELVEVNNPALFNIDSNAEVQQLWNLALGQNPNKLNAVCINSVPSAPGLGGVMTDSSCNINNSGRGCWFIAFNAAFDTVVLPHELGHVMNLPHVRTSTNPINSNNYNLMSYGTTSAALFESAPREEATSCITYFGAAPFNQFQVSNNWVHTYM